MNAERIEIPKVHPTDAEEFKHVLEVPEIKTFFEENLAQYMDVLREVASEQGDDTEYSDDLAKKVFAADEVVTAAAKKLESDLRSEPGNGKVIKDAKQLYRAIESELYNSSVLMVRGRDKPSGYAGDAKTLEVIYSNRPSPESVGIGHYLDLNFLQKPLAEAVRRRKDKLNEILGNIIDNHSGEDKMKIMSIACGACMEWRELLKDRDGEGVIFYALDQDPRSLDYAMGEFAKLNHKAEIVPLERDIKMFMSPENTELPSFMQQMDVVYSFGLYDYLPDKILNPLLMGQKMMLAKPETGIEVLSFKDIDKYDPTVYDWTTNWRFVPRTEAGITKSLVETVGHDPSKMDVTRDKSGIVAIYTVKE